MIEFILITLAAAILINASYYCYDREIKVPLFGRLNESDVVFIAVMVLLLLVKIIVEKTI